MWPVSPLREWATRSPVQTLVVYLATKTWLSSPLTGCKELVAADEDEPMVRVTLDRAALMASATAPGSEADQYWPRPFTAACHMSSTFAALPLLLVSGGMGHIRLPFLRSW